MKLDIGCGPTAREGFIGIDRRLNGEAFPLAIGGNPIADDVADVVVASHVLEHFSKGVTLDVLKEWVRVLKPGGELRIAVPDLKYALANPKHPHFEGWIMGGQTDENDFHMAIFWKEKLESQLKAVGLMDIQPWKSEIDDCAALPVSLNLMGRKPLPVTVTASPAPEESAALARFEQGQTTCKASPATNALPKVAMAVSMPSLGHNDTWGCIAAATSPWKFPVRRYTGVWWERCLQNILEDLIAEGFEYAVTTDYDSVFTATQFNTLLDFITKNPHVDAVCGVQPQRGSGLAMFCPDNTVGLPRNQTHVENVDVAQPMKVSTAHFGLTFLRLSALKDIPKPWFLNIAGQGGSWRRDARGLVDADIYFWQQWKKEGRSLYMLPWVCIGHLETLVSQIDKKTMQNQHVYPRDYIEQNFGGAVSVKREAKP